MMFLMFLHCDLFWVLSSGFWVMYYVSVNVY
jgi:hypothetical protein